MDIFVVRPFGIKHVLKKYRKGKTDAATFDFDAVQDQLITPAITRAGLQGGTTGLIFEAGSIHEEMFSLLLVADLVIADISIHNANVFYELGIRHALRDKRTILIKCPGFDETPFDILGYRYLSYDKDYPGAAVAALVKMLNETIQANRKDSPVFDKLDNLVSQDPENFLAIPDSFAIELKIVTAEKNAAKLYMMASELEGFEWCIPGLRLIGEALYTLCCLDPARTVWEKVLEYRNDDLQANERLATIYQRLAEAEIASDTQESEALFERSNIAINNLLAKNQILTPWKRAEGYALKARNAKSLWIVSWRNLVEADRPAAAIGSAYLLAAMETYERGYMECMNHYYAGINALGLLITTITLAGKYPDVWDLQFDTPDLALQKLNALKEKRKVLQSAVFLTIEAGKKTMDKGDSDYPWLKITEADFICLTENRPQRVKLSYQNAMREASNLNLDATVRQLLIYRQLGILAENIQAALEALPPITKRANSASEHTLLFTGHMIDQPGRKEPRFSPEKETDVKTAIREAIRHEQENVTGTIIGLAGGACGGDILFHEACRELGIPSMLYLTLPRDQFVAESVAFAGPKWVARFDQLYRTLPSQVLCQTKKLPQWLNKKSDYTVWDRTNIWMLSQAIGNGGLNMSLIALWNGEGGDASGGTEHMVKEARIRGAKTIIVPIL